MAMKKFLLITAFALVFLSGCTNKENPFRKEISLNPVRPVSVTMANVETGYESYSNTMYGWGLKKNVNAPPDIPDSIKTLINTYHAIYLDSTPRSLYLTFDEGYENGYTEKILDVLKENNVKAAFFVTGPYLEKEEKLVRRMIEEGHIVGNHTVHHPSMPQLDSTEKVKEEITQLAKMFQEKYGQEMKYFRPPRGEYSERTLKICEDLGYTNVFWSFAYKDWDVNQQKGTDHAYNQIKKGVHDGAVLLLHAVSKDNAEVLDKIIKDLKSEGYRFKSLDEFGQSITN
ncbi:MAG: delta-lactam-biosynthetic de-N-acetylase [Ruminococcaceae bacterium]|nr:delta-lactam-biosynthetic de-N-acetylase [Oscillospiraceae bacterium]